MNGIHVLMTVGLQYEQGITRSVQSSRIQWPFCTPLKVTVRCSQSSRSSHWKNCGDTGGCQATWLAVDVQRDKWCKELE